MDRTATPRPTDPTCTDPMDVNWGAYSAEGRRCGRSTVRQMRREEARHTGATQRRVTVWVGHLSGEENPAQHGDQTGCHVIRPRGMAHVGLATARHRRSHLHWTSNLTRERQLPLFA